LFSGGDFLFSADDLLEIEIYYNKKHLFFGAVHFWIDIYGALAPDLRSELA